MKLYEWSETLCVRIEAIDNEHKLIYDKINDLSLSLSKGEPERVLGQTLQDLITLTSEHFATEEQLFEKYTYTDATQHIAEHNKFRKKMEALLIIYRDGRYALSVDTIHYLKDWITIHIKSYDMAYASYISKKINISA
ncbi:MAG: bacteriohemerythrin [Vallitaleaceae bacterium]|jgi:hemerythrin-like metal-binding protein|nr:bacteriohemerythrin [Vallitaleaceae bacterium]